MKRKKEKKKERKERSEEEKEKRMGEEEKVRKRWSGALLKIHYPRPVVGGPR